MWVLLKVHIFQIYLYKNLWIKYSQRYRHVKLHFLLVLPGINSFSSRYQVWINHNVLLHKIITILIIFLITLKSEYATNFIVLNRWIFIILWLYIVILISPQLKFDILICFIFCFTLAIFCKLCHNFKIS